LFKKHTGSALKGAQQHLSLEGNSPSDAETYLLIGRIRMAERKRDAALEAFDKATALDPHLFEARHLAAAVRADRRDYAGAVEAETAALAIFAESGEGQRKLAEYRAALAREKEKEESDDRFDEYYQAAVRLRNEGRIAEAAASLDQAIAIRASASMLLTKARWLSDSNPTGALEAAKRAAAAGSGEAYYWIGALEQSMGRTASAISAYETYLAGSPGGSYAPEVRSILKNLRP
jgi:tetratricopeptide (TPR) repeat protein